MLPLTLLALTVWAPAASSRSMSPLTASTSIEPLIPLTTRSPDTALMKASPAISAIFRSPLTRSMSAFAAPARSTFPLTHLTLAAPPTGATLTSPETLIESPPQKPPARLGYFVSTATRSAPPVTSMVTLAAFSLALSSVPALEILRASILTWASFEVRISICPEMLLRVSLPVLDRGTVFSNFSSNFSSARAGAATKATTKAMAIRATDTFFRSVIGSSFFGSEFLCLARRGPLPPLEVERGVEHGDLLGIGGHEVIAGLEIVRRFEDRTAAGLDRRVDDRQIAVEDLGDLRRQRPPPRSEGLAQGLDGLLVIALGLVELRQGVFFPGFRSGRDPVAAAEPQPDDDAGDNEHEGQGRDAGIAQSRRAEPEGRRPRGPDPLAFTPLLDQLGPEVRPDPVGRLGGREPARP